MSEKVEIVNGDEAELMSLLERGHGRAVIFLRGKDPTLFRRIITYACIQNLVYDQCEPNRARYMYDVLHATGERDYYAPYIREAVRASTDEGDLDQLVGLARLLAKDGDQDAKKALYYVVANRRDASGMSAADEELIELDGIEGLAYVARYRVHPNPGDYYYGYAIFYVEILDDQMGKEASRAALKTLSQTDSDVASVLAEAEWFEKTLPERRKRPMPASLPSFGEFRELLSAGRNALALTTLQRWGEQADDTFVSRAADELLVETEPRRLRRLLHFFRKRAYPDEPARLIELSNRDDQEIARPARVALGNIRHLVVRDFAIETLRNPFTAWAAVDMLSRNYHDGDYELVKSALALEMSPQELHSLNFSIRDFCKAHPSLAAKEVLLILYERLHCTLCRKSTVDMLLGLGPLPEWMVEECRYDASLDLRRLVGA